MEPEDVLVILYPNKQNLQKVIILDPFDGKVLSFYVESFDEVKEILRDHLPFCYQHDTPLIHFGSVHVIEWESLPSNGAMIYRLQDIEKVLS